MPTEDKSKDTDTQKRQAKHIEEDDEKGSSARKQSTPGKDAPDRDSSATKGGGTTRPPADS